MTWEQFWDGEPEMVRFYRKANYLRIEQDNAGRWMQGAYNYNAHATCLANVFSSKKSSKAQYIERPFSILPKSDEQRLKEAEMARKQLVNMLDNFERMFNGRG